MGRFVHRSWAPRHGPSRPAEPYQAYIPDLLDGLDLSLPAMLVADITDFTVDLARAGTSLRRPEIDALINAEAIASSRMEGLPTSPRTLAMTRAGIPDPDGVAEIVLGNAEAIRIALELGADPQRAVTVDDICAMHAPILASTGIHQWSGVLRTSQAWIGGYTPVTARFVPPPAEHLPALMDDLMAYVNTDDHPALVQAAIAHAQFETIHPFADGNGRAGRALIQLILQRRGLAAAAAPLSLELAHTKDSYIHYLNATRHTDGSQQGLLAWVDFFAGATAAAMQRARQWQAGVSQWLGQAQQHTGALRSGSAAQAVLEALPVLPVFTATSMAAYLQRTPQKVNAALDRLEQAKVIVQIDPARQRNRVFQAAPELLGLLQQAQHRQLPSQPAPPPRIQITGREQHQGAGPTWVR